MSAGGRRLTYSLQTLLAALAVVALVGGWFALSSNGALHSDTDDAMRMVTAADLLAGQAWQDTTVARDNTPFGGDLHWSRLVDAPIALLIGLLGKNNAAIVWPLLLIVPLLALTRMVIGQLVPAAGLGTIAALIGSNFVVFTEFLPGRVDHHSVQIVLLQALLAALLLGRKSAGGGAIAGLLVATCLAIGLETIAIAAAAGAGLALCWLIAPQEHRRGLLGFATGLAAGAVGHFLLATPPARYFVPACDALSIVYVMALVLAAVALGACALFASRAGISTRVAVLLFGGIAAVAATALVYPSCLAGPYANVEPAVIARFFGGILEVTPLWRLADRGGPDSVLFIGTMFLAGSAVIALLVSAWLVVRRRGAARQDWLIVLFMLAAAFTVMVLQIRGARLAGMLALPAGAWMIVRAREKLRPALLQGVGLAGAWLVSATFAQFVLAALLVGTNSPGAAAATTPSIDECRRESAYAGLAALPSGGVAAPIVIASHVLRYTSHSVLSAGYHRNGQSIIDSLDFFGGIEVRARQIAAQRGLKYVVTCGVDVTIESWSWLKKLPSTGPLRLYEVAP